MSEDLIKRSDAAEVVYKALKTPPLKGVLTDTMSLAIALVRDIPSADRPQGHWTKTDVATYRCSECGKIQITDDVNELNFCCCCGSRKERASNEKSVQRV